MVEYEKHCVWSVLFRLFHWSFALSIVTLAVTGFYIHHPWTNTVLEGRGAFPVADMRFVHFVAGYVFTAAILVRLFLWFFGNTEERVTDFIPINRRNVNNLKRTLLLYLYLSDRLDLRRGHNVLAGISYVVLMGLALLQILSGFCLLFPESLAWQGWGLAVLGTQMEIRVFHHLNTWLFLTFAFIHVYIVIWNDIHFPEWLISAIFNGCKFLKKHYDY
ncbi:Ni/Fe-hydrogenase, b-type cytochrome subunit [Dissulfurirhabdus thermomarina]|uniref:Ni/Fe-hydrogenase, b-type cytochrome subunit n=1 Tax=Dissulfurirhabdus thermomarina TaxID=1765737 RepID=A0A6N9TQH1_DISTH|nr:Ni/Fe-hydrogenase, b-type cytochrome subunit [Dissulfurirhabdus thermomarina]NDY41687.1 Ni/Fe-hydrogenase, b-type cytochrome subunit [Dissulfurirhabdus thermomarina]NMX22745.1 Ni/Fe-hydrogenase, b-type cytochrome subunit [Dissulfurirhabdus thermomarina]